MTGRDFEKINHLYEAAVRKVDASAKGQTKRAYGGMVRQAKGHVTERIAKELVAAAWRNCGGQACRLDFPSGRIRIPMDPSYLKRPQVSSLVKREIASSADDTYTYEFRPDVQVVIDSKLVMVIECKAYAENAMLKRVLVDFQLLLKCHPNIKCVLFQLESQLGGDYGATRSPGRLGSPSTHVLLSHFNVNLTFLTLLKGERKVDRPIHKPDFFKPLEPQRVRGAVLALEELLRSRV